MKWAQRWSVNEEGEMVMDDHGSWVENAYYEYLKADYVVLKSDAQLVVKHLGEACADNLRLKAELTDCKTEADRLKAEVERLKAEVQLLEGRDVVRTTAIYGLHQTIKERDAEVERLRKAGDDLFHALAGMHLIHRGSIDTTKQKDLVKWNAAKEGKPSV